jgi:hypothetical protein
MVLFQSVFRKVKELWPLNEEFGENQIRIKEANAGDDLSKYLLQYKDKIESDSTFKVMSYNFPINEWDLETNFIEVCRELYKDKNIEVIAVGGPEVEAKESIKQLMNEGVIKELRLLNSPTTYHLALIQPRILWIEDYHYKNENAKNCIFTPSAYPEVWRDAKNLFEEYYNSGRPLVL